ncbi:hypothetical protein [Aquimarina litoralis]|uniref:hypothetical protein n=1 Tax=Aquimarina litoralis TaxID=584605 RepID=UPI001C58C200|nr:hypothetical protein [Aquimarina litoralis]MBW1297658.1 hypothetical protein [Aquimarina litoralis]
MSPTNLAQYASVSVLFLLLNSCKGEPKEVCDIPENITYKEHIASIIEVQCFKCHAADVYKEKASRVKIFDYPSLKKMGESGQLIGSITHAQGYIAMPYRKETKIDSCVIETIKTWVNLGMQE